jgi:hypothetical protein
MDKFFSKKCFAIPSNIKKNEDELRNGRQQQQLGICITCMTLEFAIFSQGHSGDAQNRWYYDSTDGTCKQFQFLGKKGNGNRFLTRQDCQASCQPSQARNYTKQYSMIYLSNLSNECIMGNVA